MKMTVSVESVKGTESSVLKTKMSGAVGSRRGPIVGGRRTSLKRVLDQADLSTAKAQT